MLASARMSALHGQVCVCVCVPLWLFVCLFVCLLTCLLASFFACLFVRLFALVCVCVSACALCFVMLELRANVCKARLCLPWVHMLRIWTSASPPNVERLLVQALRLEKQMDETTEDARRRERTREDERRESPKSFELSNWIPTDTSLGFSVSLSKSHVLYGFYWIHVLCPFLWFSQELGVTGGPHRLRLRLLDLTSHLWISPLTSDSKDISTSLRTSLQFSDITYSHTLLILFSNSSLLFLHFSSASSYMM